MIGVHEEVLGSCRENDLSFIDSGTPFFLLLFPMSVILREVFVLVVSLVVILFYLVLWAWYVGMTNGVGDKVRRFW